MRIDIDLLRSALSKLLDHAEETHGKELLVDEDYYWFVQKEELYDPTETPRAMTLGSLEDDWGHVEKIAKGDREAFGYALVWASCVLRSVGDRTP